MEFLESKQASPDEHMKQREQSKMYIPSFKSKWNCSLRTTLLEFLDILDFLDQEFTLFHV